MDNKTRLQRLAQFLFATPRPAMPIRVANPPITNPTSPLTRPISVVSAVDFYRSFYINRDVLLSIPAFRRAVTLIAGTVGALPYHSYNATGERVDRPFLDQPENGLGYTRSVTWTKVAEDLLLDGASLLLITDNYSDGYPKSAMRIPYPDWSQDVQTGEISYQGEKLDPKNVRLFTSPFNGLTLDAGPTVNKLAQLGATMQSYLANPQAREYFTPTEGQEPDEPDIEAFLATWEDARRRGVTAFVPAGMALNQQSMMTPDQLALNAAHDFAIAEVARLTGIDASWLSINVTTRTYSNIIDERRNFLDFVAAPYVQAIEQRLSLGDTTPIGTYVKANVDAFLRSNTLERYNAHAIGLTNGFLTVGEVRKMEDRPPLAVEQQEEAADANTQITP